MFQFFKYSVLLLLVLILIGCKEDTKYVDYIAHNGTVYTVDDEFSIQEAIAVLDGKIEAIGSSKEILAAYSSDEIIDLNGKYVYPGFFDAHGHLMSLAELKLYASLFGTNSFDEVLERLQEFQETNEFSWLIGRGWDQNDWEVKEFPSKDMLDVMFPEIPVYLVRIDGHAALLNQKALDITGFTVDTKIDRGELLVSNGILTGLILDYAMEEAEKSIPVYSTGTIEEKFLEAVADAYAVGLTSIGEAGLVSGEIEMVERLYAEDKLKVRLNVMVTDDDTSRAWIAERGKIVTDQLKVQSIKYYADGALGSRGASLIEPYSDDEENSGIPTITKERLAEQAAFCLENDLQMCVHAIGDMGNRMVLETYAETLDGENDHRWRVEHCQVVHPDDFHFFGEYNIIPSVQPTHCTSDMYWAVDRVGQERAQTAYAYKMLLNEAGIIANGSDFPIESINPLFGFYAAVARMDHDHYPEGGFQIKDALSREEALRAMTIWSAYAEFSENEKGSLEAGKLADFVIMQDDLMSAPEETLFDLKVLETWIGGERVY